MFQGVHICGVVQKSGLKNQLKPIDQSWKTRVRIGLYKNI